MVREEKYTKLRLSKIDESHIDKEVVTTGWVQAIRTSGKVGTFIDLFGSMKTLKCLCPTEIVEEAVQVYEKKKAQGSEGAVPEEAKSDDKTTDIDKFQTKNLTPHSTVTITAVIKPNHSKKDGHKIEAHITAMDIYCIAPPFPLNDSSSAFTKLEHGHLYLRTKERILFLQARSMLMKQFRKFYDDCDYLEVTPPTLVMTQVEGGATLFKVPYYGKDAYLTQSSQLYLETVSPTTGKAFCVMPSYRAEKFNTARHLSEYTHIEAEIDGVTFSELMDEIEAMVKFVLDGFYSKMKDQLLEFDKDFKFDDEKWIRSEYKRVTYAEAIGILRKHDIYKDKDEKVAYIYGDDIADRDEVALVDILGGVPVFLTNFPVEHKPFYCRKEERKELDEMLEGLKIDKSEYSGQSTQSVDLLWPGIGEILGGSMRAESHTELMDGFKREGIDPAPYYWYTDLRLWDANIHGGYGLGFERLLKAIMDYQSVNSATLYPRFPGRCEP